jgi:hypothetical protein
MALDAQGVTTDVRDTVMRDHADRERLARAIIEAHLPA